MVDKMYEKAIELIMKYEGFRSKAYLCPAGKPTIGYGTTEGVKLGDKITKWEAEERLKKDVHRIAEKIKKLVRLPLNENQEAALISFAYNVGINALDKSTLLSLINAGYPSNAADEFPKWNKATVNGKKVILDGLTARRLEERHLFLKEVKDGS